MFRTVWPSQKIAPFHLNFCLLHTLEIIYFLHIQAELAFIEKYVLHKKSTPIYNLRIFHTLVRPTFTKKKKNYLIHKKKMSPSHKVKNNSVEMTWRYPHMDYVSFTKNKHSFTNIIHSLYTNSFYPSQFENMP